MNKTKKQILINLLVICLYFIWPYFLNSVISLFSISETISLYISFSVNFIFLMIIIYIYRNILKKNLDKLNEKGKKDIFLCIKSFVIGLIIFFVLNALLYNLGIPYNNNTSSMINIFKKIPVIFVLNTIFYYPVIEELVFKMSLKEIIKNNWCFIIITGLLNAFFQIVFSITRVTDLLYLLPYTIFFGSLSYGYSKTDNIIYSIILRVCYNLIPCIVYIIELINI